MHLNEYLLKLADVCDRIGHNKIADEIELLIESGSFVKISQYCGVVGYALKNERAISNCLRKKRVASDQPMQEIVMECLSEYQNGQNYDDEEWIGKYANKDIKTYVSSVLKTAVANGIDISTATRNLIEELTYENNLSQDVENINKVYEMARLASLDSREEFRELTSIYKKAAQLGLWQGMKNVWRGYGRGGSQAKQVSGNLREIQQNLQSIIKLVTSKQPAIDFVKKLTGKDPARDYNGFIQAVNQISQQFGVNAGSNQGIKTAEKKPPLQNFSKNPTINVKKPPGGYPQTQTESTSSSSPKFIQSPTVDPVTARTNLQAVISIGHKLKSYVQNVTNLVAKLRTFPSITSDETLRTKTEEIFNTFNSIKTPFDINLLNKMVNVVGQAQQQLNSVSTAQQPTGVSSDILKSTPVTQKPLQGAAQTVTAYQSLLPLLKQDTVNGQKVINYLRRLIGLPPEKLNAPGSTEVAVPATV